MGLTVYQKLQNKKNSKHKDIKIDTIQTETCREKIIL